MSDNNPATKADLDASISRMERFVLEREIKALRWFTGIQVAYFAITLSAVWFLVSQLNNQVREDLSQLKADTKELRAEVQQLLK